MRKQRHRKLRREQREATPTRRLARGEMLPGEVVQFGRLYVPLKYRNSPGYNADRNLANYLPLHPREVSRDDTIC